MANKRIVTAALAVALSFGQTEAHAEEANEAQTVWYGHTILLADVVSTTVLVTGAATDQPAVAWAGVGGLALAGPAIHVAHGRPEMALASLGTRLALPVLGATIGYAAAGTCHENPDSHSLLGDCFLHGYAEAAVGGMIGLGVASLADIGLFAHERVEPAAPRAELAWIAPRLDPRSRAMSLDVGGVF